MTDDETLVPELKEWRKHNGPDFSIDSWLACEGSISLAIGFSSVFWPDFTEYDGCVFIKSHFSEDNYKAWVSAPYIKHYAQIESVINHIHILDFFSPDKNAETKDAQIRFLGNKLCEIYRVKLKAGFPDREFIVTFNGDQDQEDPIDYELSFYQPVNLLRTV